MRRPIAPLFLPLALAAACADAAGPGRPVAPRVVEVALAAELGAPRYVSGGAAPASVECRLDLNVTATGEAGGSGEWRRLLVHYFAGPDWNAPVDSLIVNDPDLGAAFGNPVIGAGQTQHAAWLMRAGLPFAVEVEVRYFTAGTLRSASAPRRTCGPAPAANASVPSLVETTLHPAEGPVQPGDEVVLGWRAAAPAGVWELGYQREDEAPVYFFAGPGAGSSAARSVGIPVRGEDLGRELRFRVFAVDRAGRIAMSPVLATSPVVDVTPPQLTHASLDGHGNLAGSYGAGDGLRLHLGFPTDNHRVSHVVYEVAGMRDSVPYPSGGVDPLLLPTRPEWVGASDFRVHARDPSGNRSRVIEAAPGAVRFYPVRSVEVDVAAGPYGSADHGVFDPATGTVWTVGGADLSAYGGPAFTRRSVHVPDAGAALDLSVGGDTLVVAAGGGIAFVDLRRGETVTTVPLDVASVTGLRVAHDGEVVVLAIVAGGGTDLVGYHPATGVRRVIRAGTGVTTPLAGVVRSGDRRRMVVGGRCVYDAVTHVMGACRDLGFSPVAAGNVDGTRWVGGGTLYDAQLNAVRTFPGLQTVRGAAFVAGGEEVFFATERGPLRVRASDGFVVERYVAPTGPGGLATSADGEWLAGWNQAGQVYRLRLP